MFDDCAETLTNDHKDLWKRVHSIYIEAERCQNHHKDENAWVEIVRSVLRAAGLGNPEDMLEINSV